MNIHSELLDTPLETRISTPKGSIITKVDLGINLLLLTGTVAAGIGTVFDNSIGMAFLLGLFFLGSYQLLSALIGGIRGNRSKLYYLGGALLYLVLLASGTEFSTPSLASRTPQFFLIVFAFPVLPLAGAFYFTKLCYETIKSQ